MKFTYKNIADQYGTNWDPFWEMGFKNVTSLIFDSFTEILVLSSNFYSYNFFTANLKTKIYHTSLFKPTGNFDTRVIGIITSAKLIEG